MSDTLRGILLMIAAMVGFAFEDMFIKLSGQTLSTGQILVMLGFGGTVLLALLARRAGVRLISPHFWHPAVMLRNAGEMIGTFGFILAITLLPLTTMSAILQALPLAVTAGAALFLGEAVGWRRWCAIATGFVGVLIIIRPGLEGFQIASLWAVLGVAGLAMRDIATRRVPRAVPSLAVATWGFFSIGLVGAIKLAAGEGLVMPGPAAWGFMGAAIFAGVGSYWAMTVAVRLAEIGVLAPFRYVRLLCGVLFGLTVFQERPDLPVYLGMALIIGSGLYTFARERRLARRPLSMTADAR